MLLTDIEIRNLCRPPYASVNYPIRGLDGKSMIDGYSEAVSGNGVISYGLSSAGYDLRLAEDVLLFPPIDGPLGVGLHAEIDPKRFKEPQYKRLMLLPMEVREDQYGRYVRVPPHSYVLGRSYEYLRIPRLLKGRCTGKSTLARCGILVNTTPLEPEWEGHLTLEIGNVTPLPALLYVMEGVAQLEFELLSGNPQISYKDKGGKYQGQTGVTPAVVR